MLKFRVMRIETFTYELEIEADDIDRALIRAEVGSVENLLKKESVTLIDAYEDCRVTDADEGSIVSAED